MKFNYGQLIKSSMECMQCKSHIGIVRTDFGVILNCFRFHFYFFFLESVIRNVHSELNGNSLKVTIQVEREWAGIYDWLMGYRLHILI